MVEERFSDDTTGHDNAAKGLAPLPGRQQLLPPSHNLVVTHIFWVIFWMKGHAWALPKAGMGRTFGPKTKSIDL